MAKCKNCGKEYFCSCEGIDTTIHRNIKQCEECECIECTCDSYDSD